MDLETESKVLDLQQNEYTVLHTVLREIARQGGLTRFRRATETPFNLILEARA